MHDPLEGSLVKQAKIIKSRLERRMDLWEGGKIAKLVQDTVKTAM